MAVPDFVGKGESGMEKKLKEEPSAASAGCQWVVHVIGPDDLIDQPDEMTALREANALNVAFAKDRESIDGDPNYPVMMAVAKQVKVCVHGKPEDTDCHDCNW
jgi:hypothetical protein